MLKIHERKVTRWIGPKTRMAEFAEDFIEIIVQPRLLPTLSFNFAIPVTPGST